MKRRSYLVISGVLLLLAGGAAFALLRSPQTAGQFLASGRVYFGEQEYAEAAVQFMNALRHDPVNREARYLLAMSLLAEDRYNGAAQELRTLLADHPDDVEASLQLGNVYLRFGSGNSRFFDEARAIAGQLLARDPQGVPALILLGNALAGLQDYRSAATAFRDVLSLDPENTSALISLGSSEAMQDNLAQAEQAYLRARELAPGNKDALMALAVFYRATSQNDRAEAMLSEALALDPSDRAVYVQLVALYMTTGRFDQAASVLREAQDLDPGDPEPSLLLSMLYRSEGRAAEADRILLDLRETFPSDTGVAASLAQALMLEDPERSRAEIDRILQIDPEGTAGHILLGTWLFTEGRYEEAEASLSRDRVVEGSSPVASFLLGRIAEIRGDPDRARIEFRNSVNLNPAYLPARLALAELLIRQGGRLEEARVEVSGVLALDPRSVPGRLARGALDTAGGRYEEAEAAFAELRREEPDNARVHLRTGLNHEASGSAARAEDSLRRALGLDPGSEEILAHLARFYASRGRVDDAIRAITDAARHLERPSVHHHLMGLAYLQGGRLNEAEAAFRTAVELEPGRADSRGFLARLCLEAGRPGEALEHTDALLRLRPLDPGAHTTRALILETQGDVAAAKASYTRALEIDPDSFPAANNLAYILGEEGLLGEALGWAQNARRAEPANPNVADTLGWIQHRLGNQVLARQQLEFAVSVEPENPAFLYHLAMVYREAGQPAEAADALGRALDSGRDFADRELAEAALSEIGESR